jgi:EAL domain-containing protein (putative c-di-GMP-specific phosphodiesterase class I)
MLNQTLASPIAEFFGGPGSGAGRPLEQRLQKMLHAIRKYLGLDVAFLSKFKNGRRFFTHVDSSEPGGPIAVGRSDPLEETYCQRIVDGRFPELVQDIASIPEARTLSATLELPVGAYLCLPIRLPNGKIHGTLCCIGHAPDRSLNQRDLSVMRIFAEIVSETLAQEAEAKQLRTAMEKRIEAVLSGNCFDMVYQPTYCVLDNQVVGFESLARFSALPLRAPDIWFGEAAQVGLGSELECSAIELALEGAKALPMGVYLSVNASPKTIMEGDLGRRFDKWPINRLVLEVTEHAIIDSYSEIASALRPLRDRGLRLAIDDVGAGYANFQAILNLNPDMIKLDIGITRHVDTDIARRALVAALVGFSGETGIEIVAEGVETALELSVLQQLGVTRAQGFLFGEAMTIAEAIELVQRPVHP